METIIAASKNKHKIKEIEKITNKFGMKIISRDEANIPNVEIIEDGKTFEENSLKKAKEISKLCNRITIADDSGLMVDALDGAPGVFSARFSGEDSDDETNNKKLLELLKDVKDIDRTAKFVSVITMYYPDGTSLVARGECKGKINFKPLGENGFGYDPLFVPDNFEKTFAELTEDEKNSISHRAKALEELEKILKSKNTLEVKKVIR